MPKPREGEDQNGFVARCMGDKEALADFPRADQRHAFCQSQWTSAQEAMKEAKDKRLVTLEVSGDGTPLEDMVEYIGKQSSVGHSFEVVVDPDDSEYRRAFGFDGDGNFRVDIKATTVVKEAAKTTTTAPGEIEEWVRGKKKRVKEAAHETEAFMADPEMVEAFRGAGLLEGDVLDYCAGPAAHEFAMWNPEAPDPTAFSVGYDTIMMTHALPAMAMGERLQALAAARGLLREGGTVLFGAFDAEAELEEEDIANLGLGYADGWATGRAYQSGWTGDEWQQFFLDQAWNPTPVEAPEGRVAFELEPRKFSTVLDQPTNARVGKTEDDVQRGQPSYGAVEAALVEGFALSKRWPDALGSVE